MPRVLTNVSTLNVPENGTATFQVKLSGRPDSTVTVTTSRYSGDGDISVSSGATLTFTRSNYATYQTVTLAARSDSDTSNGSTTFRVRCSDSDIDRATVTAYEVDKNTTTSIPAMVFDKTAVDIPAGGTATVLARFSSAPASNVIVTVGREAGDADISVAAGSSLTFTPSNWNTYQAVTLAAAGTNADPASSATIWFRGTGVTDAPITASQKMPAIVPAVVLTAGNVNVPAGGTATFGVSLNAQPTANVTVNVALTSGDSDISVASGASLTFTPSDYSAPKTVTLAATAGNTNLSASATFEVSGAGVTPAALAATQVAPSTLPSVLLSAASLNVPSGGNASFTVKLSSAPFNPVTINVSRTTGDADLSVANGGTLTFTAANFSAPQTVTLAASATNANTSANATFNVAGANVTGASLTATQTAPATLPSVVLSTSSLDVPAGGTASFTVKLSAAPFQAVTLAASRTGDADVTVASGGSMTFTASNWSVAQTVTLAAAATNADVAASATISVGGTGVTAASLTAIQKLSTTTSVTIDPISRVEGHLRIEVEVSGGKVTKAWSTIPLYRGIETILKTRDPRDAPNITQRLCGVCTYIHQLCSVRTIEKSLNLTIPDNARTVRNLMNGALFVHDHIVHFYHLHAMDWVDVTKALTADPAATQTLAASISPSAKAYDFAAVKTRLANFVNTGQLGPFANAYWGHSAYKLTAEENLLLAAHYLDALTIQVKAAKLMAILGGKNPHPQSAVVGGVTCGAELNATRLTAFRTLLTELRTWVKTIYKPDLKLVASKYPEWASIGGNQNFLAFGEFPLSSAEPTGLFMPRGLIFGGDVMGVQTVDTTKITEHVHHSWYSGSVDRHPSSGETVPAFTAIDHEGKYSWSKAPRYNNSPMEVGPLARVLVAYGLGNTAIRAEVDALTAALGVPLSGLMSTLGRTAARMIETVVLGDAMDGWLTTLQNNLNAGATATFVSYPVPKSVTGAGLNEAPRGALGHWLNVDANGKIANYQMVVPSTWNFGPRDYAGVPGPIESALVGCPVADPANPVEVLRIVHSFDPCLACGVHVLDVDTGKRTTAKAL